MDEREPGAMNQLARLRELQIREANRGVREASRARAHRPPAAYGAKSFLIFSSNAGLG